MGTDRLPTALEFNYVLGAHSELTHISFACSPDRLSNLPETVKLVPGLISNIMTFSEGSHSCPGSPFAIMEIKVFIVALVLALEFAPSPRVVMLETGINVRPMLARLFTRAIIPFICFCSIVSPSLTTFNKNKSPSTDRKGWARSSQLTLQSLRV